MLQAVLISSGVCPAESPARLGLGQALYEQRHHLSSERRCRRGCAFWLGYAPVVSGLIGVVVFLGLWIWAIPGWGRYFASLHGHDTRKEEEISWIDRIGIAVFP